jgi:F-type H+-transporting ATPase subunit b
MNIDWFTFFAQIVNFLVLVALLRWLLYDRVVDAMERREQRIAERHEAADRKQAEAEEKAEQWERKQREIDRRREELLDEARNEVNERRQQLLGEARREVDEKRRQWREAYRRERDDLLAQVRGQAGRASLEAARRSLSQLAGADLERHVFESFATRMRDLDEEKRQEVERQLDDGGAEAVVRSAFELSGEQKDRLREVLEETFRHETRISLQTTSELICGLELEIGGFSFGWSVKGFLEELEADFREQMESTG